MHFCFPWFHKVGLSLSLTNFGFFFSLLLLFLLLYPRFLHQLIVYDALFSFSFGISHVSHTHINIKKQNIRETQRKQEPNTMEDIQNDKRM